MKALVAGIGVWGPGFSNLEQLQIALTSREPILPDDVVPKPERIASRERRRAPLMVKLAIEVADQAFRMADLDPGNSQSVFSSGIGDADITDYMCRILAGPDKMLSPTKFHNSVHNAAAGYWSISTACAKPATFISSMHNSFSLALVEAMVQVTADEVPVLLVVSDLAMPEPMRDIHAIERMFGAAFVLAPMSPDRPGSPFERSVSLSLTPTEKNHTPWPAMNPSLDNGALATLYSVSPAARSLCFLEALCQDDQWLAQLPVSDALNAELSLAATAASQPALSRLGG